MADIADVNMALVNLISSAVYPNGTALPSAIVMPDGSNPACRVYAGWPLPSDLEADVAAKILNISVYCQPGMEQNVSRYPYQWVDQTKVASTITATVSGSTITLGGTITVGNYVSIVSDQIGVSYAATGTDTLATIAAQLASQFPANLNVTASGPVITIPNRTDIAARTAAPGTVMQEVERVKQRFQMTIWGWNNDARVAAARLLRPILATSTFLNFPEGTSGRLIYQNSMDIDRSDKISISCRDFFYWVEYPIIQVAPGYPITIARNQITTGNPGVTDAPTIQQDF